MIRDRHGELDSEAVDKMVEIATEIFKGKEFSDDLVALREERELFEKKLGDYWRKPIDLLESFIWVAFNAGKEFNDKNRAEASRRDDHVFEALSRLHAKACQTSFAVLTLLRSGFADDAYARWRSLHEIAVIGSFISENGQKLAEKYLQHQVIQQCKIIRAQIEAQGPNSVEEVFQDELDDWESRQKELLGLYGKRYKSDYGWAEEALKGNSLTFRAIEEQVQLNELRPNYRMASDNVHANSRGLYFRLGLDQNGGNVILAGASNVGLAEPGPSTAISLKQITVTLLDTKPNPDTPIATKILASLVDEIGQAFLEVHNIHKSIVLAEKERRQQFQPRPGGKGIQDEL